MAARDQTEATPPSVSERQRFKASAFATKNGTTGSWDSQIAVSNIFFSPVPEVNPELSAAGVCFVGLGAMLLRRRSR
jgi:hypothetical protein